MKYSLRKRYIVVGCGLIAGFLILSLLLNVTLQEPVTYWQYEKKMEKTAREALNEIPGKDQKELQEYFDRIEFQNNLHFTLLDQDHEVILTTRMRERNQGNVGKKTKLWMDEIQEELDEQGFFVGRNIKEQGDGALLLRIDKIDGYGYLLEQISIHGITRNMEFMQVFYILSGLITLAIGSILIACLSKKMVEPLLKMSKVTEQIAALNFDERVDIKSQDELGTLAESINGMSVQLKENMEKLQRDIQLRKNLVRNMAHELKTPIAVLSGYAENMKFIAKKHPEKLEIYCRVIAEECVRMNNIVQEMLEVSAYEEQENVMRKTSFSSEEFFKKLREEFLQDTLNTEVEYQEKDEINGEILADYSMLTRAVYNYLKNAVQHSARQGIVRLEGRETQSEYVFTVYNEGSFIPEEEQEKIWDVFYKIDKARTRERNSCGIGLSIVKQVALAHDGRAEVRNTDGGVEFLISVRKT